LPQAEIVSPIIGEHFTSLALSIQTLAVSISICLQLEWIAPQLRVAMGIEVLECSTVDSSAFHFYFNAYSCRKLNPLNAADGAGSRCCLLLFNHHLT